LAMTAIDLLWGGAESAREIMSTTKPRMTNAEYLAFQRGINQRVLFDGMTLQAKLLS
jgi:hypothetical protein